MHNLLINGDDLYLKVIFYWEGESEGMWVKVKHENARQGKLDNEPVVVPLKRGQTVKFTEGDEGVLYWDGKSGL